MPVAAMLTTWSQISVIAGYAGWERWLGEWFLSGIVPACMTPDVGQHCRCRCILRLYVFLMLKCIYMQVNSWYFYPGVFQPSWCRPPARLSWLNLNFETGRLFVLLDGRKDKQLIIYVLLRMIKTTLNRGKLYCYELLSAWFHREQTCGTCTSKTRGARASAHDGLTLWWCTVFCCCRENKEPVTNICCSSLSRLGSAATSHTTYSLRLLNMPQ